MRNQPRSARRQEEGVANNTKRGVGRLQVVAAALALLLGGVPWPSVAQFAIGTAADPLGRSSGGAIATDAGGNVYVTGHFGRTIDFDPGPGVADLTATGTSDAFVASYDAFGVFRWAFGINGYFEDFGYDIAVGPTGSIYVTGAFQGANVDFDPGPDELPLSSVNAARSAFVAAYSTDGELEHAFVFGSSIGAEAYSLAIDNDNNVCVVGRFQGTIDLAPGPTVFELTQDQGWGGFLACYGEEAAIRFGRKLPAYANGVAVDSEGNVFITGYFGGEAEFAPGVTLIGHGNTNADLFVAGYDPTGDLRFAVGAGGGHDDVGKSISTDAAGNVFIAGYFSESVDFDPEPPERILTSNGGRDIVLASYSPEGALRFAVGFGGTSNDEAYHVEADDPGNSFIGGYFARAVDFDPSAATYELSANPPEYYEAFFASYTTDGSLRFARQIGGERNDYTRGITFGSESVCVTGLFQDEADLNPDSRTLLLRVSPNAGDECFVACYDGEGRLTTGLTQFVSAIADPQVDSVGLSVDQRTMGRLPFGAVHPPVFIPATSVPSYDLYVSGSAGVTRTESMLVPDGDESVVVLTGHYHPAAESDSVGGSVIDFEPPLGKASVSSSAVFNAVYDEPALDVYRHGALLAADVLYKQSTSIALENARNVLDVRAQSDGRLLETFAVDLSGYSDEAVALIVAGFVTPPDGSVGRELRMIAVTSEGQAFEADVVTDVQGEGVPSELSIDSVYPNPSSGAVVLSVTMPAAALVHVEVFDVSGRRIAERTENLPVGRELPVSLALSGTPSGVYLVRLSPAVEPSFAPISQAFVVVR